MKKRWLSLALMLLLAVLLTWRLRDFVAEALVPLYYLYWVGRRLLETIPQVILWAVFLLVALLLAGGSLLRPPPGQSAGRRAASPRPNRIEAWVKLLGQADQETYYRWQLAQHLQELTLDALAHHQRLSLKEIRQQLAGRRLNLPPEIVAYLRASLTSFSHFAGPAKRYPPPPASPLDLEPERVIQFLEEKLDHLTD
ncbi:MAG: hypothetical protein AB1801_08390 [Chloroflexota bacterium]